MTEPRRDLESVQIPEPCSADWASMLGDERRRYCDQCELHVHNVAALPRDEAEALIARKEQGEKVCVRMEYAPDGTCVTADPPRAASPQRTTALALALGTGLLAACRGDEPRTPGDPQPVENAAVGSGEQVRLGEPLMGDVALPVVDECDEPQGGEQDDEQNEAQSEDGEPTLGKAPHGILMGRISATGTVTVNADGQLTAGDDGAQASGPGGGCLPPTLGEVGLPATGGGPSDDAPPAVMGTPGPSGSGGSDDGSSSVESWLETQRLEGVKPKGRVILGTPGPRGPKPKPLQKPEPKD